MENLYKCNKILSNAKDNNIQNHEAEYNEILKAVKGTSEEKRLASKFIGKFFKYFPHLAEDAIDAQLHLCEDEDMQIRRDALKYLPYLCTKNYTVKICLKLAKLCHGLTNSVDLRLLNLTLHSIFEHDAKNFLTEIFSQIGSGDGPIRVTCFKFIASKVFSLGSDVITKEVEDFIIDEIKKILKLPKNVTDDEFHYCMDILRATKLGSSPVVHTELVNLAKEQAELDADIDHHTIEDEIVERFIQCANHALPYFSAEIKSTPFIIYMCDKLLPIKTWNMIAVTEVNQDQVQLRLLKVFAEMCGFCGILEDAAKRFEAIFTMLRKYMPLPKLDDELLNSTPSFQISHVECLLYALYTIGKQNPDSLTFINEPAKKFASILNHVAQSTDGNFKILKVAKEKKLTSEEKQLNFIALRAIKNITSLIRDLKHSPPSFKTEISLSWVTRKSSKLGKHHAPIIFTENGKPDEAKKQKPTAEQKVYQPPSGKYSGKVQNYSGSRSRSKNENSQNDNQASTSSSQKDKRKKTNSRNCIRRINKKKILLKNEKITKTNNNINNKKQNKNNNNRNNNINNKKQNKNNNNRNHNLRNVNFPQFNFYNYYN